MRQTQKREQKFCLHLEREKRRRNEQAKFDQVAAQYLTWAEQHRPRSIGSRRAAAKHLIGYFGDTPLSRIGKMEVEKFIQECLDSGMSPASINRCRSMLSSIFTKAIDWGLCSHNAAIHYRTDLASSIPR